MWIAEYERECRECGAKVGKRFFHDLTRILCQPCLTRANPAEARKQAAHWDQRGIFEGTAAERIAKALEDRPPVRDLDPGASGALASISAALARSM